MGKKVDVVAEVDEEVSAESIDLDLTERKQLKEKKVKRKGEAARYNKTQAFGESKKTSLEGKLSKSALNLRPVAASQEMHGGSSMSGMTTNGKRFKSKD